MPGLYLWALSIDCCIIFVKYLLPCHVGVYSFSRHMEPDHGLFPIRHVSEATGVLTVTLRAWERRYGLLKPQRTPKGHRLYSAADIDRVQRILVLLRQGVSIGQVRQVLDSQGGTMPASSVEAHTAMREQMQEAALAIDVLGLSDQILEAGRSYPLPVLADRVLRPLLHALARQADARHQAAVSVLHEAIHAALLRRMMHVPRKPGQPAMLFAALPGDEGLSYRLAWAMAVESGLAVHAAGRRLPPDYLKELGEQIEARALVVWADDEPEAGWEVPLVRLAGLWPGTLYVGGELAARHASQLEGMGLAVLPLDLEQAIRTLGTHAQQELTRRH